MNTGQKSLIKRLLGDEIDIKVFYGATALALPFIILGGLAPSILEKVSSIALTFLTDSFSWLYLISCSVFVLVSIGDR